jgi:lipooligosaccharide transport system ATP-binding protein
VSSTPPAIRLRGVVKRFGQLTAVDDLSLDVEPGICFGLLGPNGAGKSTLMRLLTGGAVADAGVVEVMGLAMPAHSRQVRARCGLSPQTDNLDDELTCRDNLAVYARLYGVPRERRTAAVTRGLELARLVDKADTYCETLSGGMRRRLLIARALLHDPEVVLLDEPTVGLDPQIRQQLWQQIDQIRAAGKTIVLTTHYIEEAERLCDRVAIVHHGRLLDLGPPRDLIARHIGSRNVVEVYGDEACKRRVIGAAVTHGIVHRHAGTSVALFVDELDGLATVTTLQPGDLDHHLVRPANLEDVFVDLTGEDLG